MKTKYVATLPIRDSINRAPVRRGVLVIALGQACFASFPMVRAQDGAELNGNTAAGSGALHTYISTASSASRDTAIGYLALNNDTTGSWNTAIGAGTLFSNTIGANNTETGDGTLNANINSNDNTATGARALNSKTTGDYNTATGAFALQNTLWDR
jgi:hypothetical protein